MELTVEQLSELEEMSAALLPPSEIAILMDIPADQRDLFCEICKTHKLSAIYTAYQKVNLKQNMIYVKRLSSWLRPDHRPQNR